MATLSIGCSGQNDPISKGAGPSVLAPPGRGQGFQIDVRGTVPSGEEAVICKHAVVEQDIEVSRLEHAYSTGGHHILAYRTDLAASDVDSSVFHCGDIAGPLVYTSGTSSDETRLPAGVGLRLRAGEVLRIELHFPNATAEEGVAHAALNFWKASEPLATEAGSFFFYHRDIVIPALGRAKATMRCEMPADIKLHSVTPHTHLLGTRFSARVVGAAGERTLVESTAYGDLERREFPEPISIRAGDQIEVECDFENPRSEPVIEGPSKTENEMCLLLADYHPRLDAAAEWCTLPGSGALHAGKLTCGETLGCSQSAKSDTAAELCFVDVCLESSQALGDFTNCAFNHCNAECVFGGPDCVPCASAHCATEMSACFAATCGS